ncbi:MAG: hypothetical protein WD266_02210 [Balneolales bacterium]
MAGNRPILLQHGWGFDSSMWKNWVHTSGDDDFILPDRGYFGEEKIVDVAQVEMAVTHSFGLHLLPAELIPRLKQLVILSGFQEFHPNTPIERTFSQRIVRYMLRNIEGDSETVLKKFCQNCYHPDESDCPVPPVIDAKRLHEDLVSLDCHKLDINLLRLAGRIVIIHGMKDGIVPHNKAFQLQYSLPGSEIITHEDGSHMIPVTHARWCLDRMAQLS